MKKTTQVVILAGGLGTRLEEETTLTPKPMVMLGQLPILVHIMNIYSHFGFNDFIICLGYKGYVIKEYFANYFLHNSNITFDFSLGRNKLIFHSKKIKPWKVTLVDTGLDTQTGGRLKMIEKFIKGENFFFTYGDGLANIDISMLLKYHLKHKKMVTVTGVNPPGRFGTMELNSKKIVQTFVEKPVTGGGWINGGYFVLNRKVFEFIDDENTPWEFAPMQKITQLRNVVAYLHQGFWKCMDTLRDKRELENMWNSGSAPWIVHRKKNHA